VNYSQTINPLSSPKTNADATTANNNYVSVLMYIQNNPLQSTKIITDIKNKFFDDTCKVKSNIDFKDIASLPNGVPFGAT
jgi:hypothetical protein